VRPISLDDWWSVGGRRSLEVAGARREIFVMKAGSGPTMTMLHGFPSSSHDWAKVMPALTPTHTVLAPDFLGFGASDKPRDHTYSIAEQADLVEAVWESEGTEKSAVVAHDYGVSVAQELLARRDEGALRVELESVRFLNGGLYPDLHRPEPTQLALLDPDRGPAIAEAINAEVFSMALAPIFAEGFDARADTAAIWRATAREDGQRLMDRLIRYIPDRVENAERWTGALEGTDVPVSFAWGMLDPVSGAHMAARIRERLPSAPLLVLDDVCHWPQLEAPERITASLLG
jgi:pimeloyl-ACP methyl ester carboxylesterase